MVEAESGVSQVLSSIRGKLKRYEIVNPLPIRGEELTVEEALIRAVRSTSVARSEFTINPEEVKLLDERVNEIRSWVLGHGHRVGDVTDPEEPVCFQYNAGPYSALTDLEDLGDDTRTRLFLIVVEDKHPMEVWFDFRNHFSLEIFFEDPENHDRSLHYNSSRKPLDEMTPQEYEIIQHYLGEYSKEATSR